MQLHYLFVVVASAVSDVKVASSTVSYCNIRTEPRFQTEPNQTHSEPNPCFFSKPNWNQTK